VYIVVNNNVDIIPDLIDATRKSSRVMNPKKEEALLLFGALLGCSAHYNAPFASMLQNLGERTVDPIFLDRGISPKELEVLDPHQIGAILSVAGPLPALLLNTLAITQGIQWLDKHPKLSRMMIGYGAANQILSCIEPWSAAMMSAAELEKAASAGHNFANLAIEMHQMTGLSIKTAAVADAVLWTVLIPAFLLACHVNSRTCESNAVTDLTALKHWLVKAQTDEATQKQFLELAGQYEKTITNDELSLNRFCIYVIENIPEKLKEIKHDIIGKNRSSDYSSRTEKILSNVSLFGTVGYVAVRIGHIATRIFWSVSPVVSGILFYSIPFFSALSLTYELYTTMKELNNEEIPKRVKMLSVAKLVCSVVSTVVLVGALFIPGVNLIALGVYLVCLGIVIGLCYAKNTELKRHLDLKQALEPENFDFMIAWSKQQTEHPEQYRGLIHWQNCIKEAIKESRLTPDQLKRLADLQLS
jgi:hypothetical protein